MHTQTVEMRVSQSQFNISLMNSSQSLVIDCFVPKVQLNIQIWNSKRYLKLLVTRDSLTPDDNAALDACLFTRSPPGGEPHTHTQVMQSRPTALGNTGNYLKTGVYRHRKLWTQPNQYPRIAAANN